MKSNSWREDGSAETPGARPPGIRAATALDAPAIAGLHAASWRSAYSGTLPRDYLATTVGEDLRRHWAGITFGPEDVVLVAEEGGAMVGFVAVWCRPDPVIDNLHVRPGRRSAGTGRALMVAAAEALMARGHRSAHLWVVAENHRALAFYERLGGRRDARADLDIFGHAVPQVKVVWPDLSVLAS